MKSRQHPFHVVLTVILILAFGALPAPPPAGAEPTEDAAAAAEAVEMTTSDGVKLAGSFHAPSTPAAKGVLLLHMLGRSKESLSGLASRLRAKGFAVLAIDLRGHGESTRTEEGSIHYMAFTSKDYAAMDSDVDAALAFLAKRIGKGSPIGILGASIGANLALRAGATHDRVAGVVLLSPSLDYRGIRTQDVIPRYGDRPLFVATAEDDGFSAEGSEEIAEKASSKVVFRKLPGTSHGTQMLATDRELLAEVLAWIEANVKPGSGG